MSKELSPPTANFIRNIINKDISENKNNCQVTTRFPPEPNGYLHIGHAKSICLNFGLASEYKGGICHLRFDDTNPSKEDDEYIESILKDVKWLGFDWKDSLFNASDYFNQMYSYAVQLINIGKAYVCSLNANEMRAYRGTLTEPGKNSPFRNRSIKENLDLFERMKNGEFQDGTHLLRAKIDMSSPNFNMRDPALYRIKHEKHHKTGNDWCIYPMYDFAHCISDSIEKITHSLCTLEFEDHRPLYDWILNALETKCHPQQIEFARLNLSYTIMSKRKLKELVENKDVSGWDDPRMPTISGLRRRGYTPLSIRNFCERIGVAKRDSLIDMVLLENSIREDLNENAPRVMGVLNPLKVVIENYLEDKIEKLEAANHPQKPENGVRTIFFSKEIYIEQDDFMEDPPKKFFRLGPGREVRLRNGFFIKCEKVIKDEKTGKVTELRCTYDPTTKGGSAPDGRKVKGTIHWVSATCCVPAKVYLYDRLFLKENPATTDKDKNFRDYLNPNSLEVLKNCYIESNVKDAKPGTIYQFERQGYFCVDTSDSNKNEIVFNRTVSLRDSWAKLNK